ncbi:sigma-70 family RNA polymerase sigma factor [Patescibacteria group bacterium]|nr:sigma-70 family RNA polymerase sigma factor [Patescibacteria group bacterium]MBU1448763.1 sigma-70 family RNA polymerase sigma factor [Patescibacteria group bacterium]MBU2613303.1 sigma-70 family RNA polymerase sigma factor [Patescibacteria group bacterium]
MSDDVTKTSDDRDLFGRLASDPSAIGEAYDLYADRLYGFLLKRCGHKETAEDLVSRTFMKLLESAPTLEWRGASLGAWLFRVASNLLTDHWRSASVRKDEAVDPDTWDPPSADDPAWNAHVSIEGDRLRETLKRLSARDQQVIDMKFYGGCDTAEIAAGLGVTPNHAAVLVYRAIGRLRVAYLAHGTPSSTNDTHI